MILSIGEILFDVFREGRVLGGAPFNVAVHLKNLGVPVRFFSRVGKDDHGREILSAVEKYGLNASDIQRDAKRATGTVEVDIDSHGKPSFTIIKNTAYDYISYSKALRHAVRDDVQIIYFGSLIQRSKKGFRTLQKVLKGRSVNTRCLYDINLRPLCYSNEIILHSLQNTHILKLNDEELEVLKGILHYNVSDDALIARLFEDFPIEMIALTRGARGAALITRNSRHEGPVYPVDHIEDTVGAGDAFAAILAMGILRSWKTPMILEKALRFSSLLCEVKGAIPRDNGIYHYMLDYIAGKG